MPQDNDGSDLSDLKQRLGLDESEESETPQGEAGEQQAGEQARHDAQKPDDGRDSQPVAGSERGAEPGGHSPSEFGGGGDSDVDQNAPTRVGPPPGEDGRQANQDGGQGPGGADQKSEFSETTPQESPRAEASVGTPGSGPPTGGGSPQNSAPPPGSASGPPGGAGSPGDGGPPGQSSPPGSGGGSSRLGSAGSAPGGGMAPDRGDRPGGDSSPKPEDIDLDEDVDFGNSTFSGPVLGLVAGALVLGAVFGLIGMSSYKAREMYQARTKQAQQVLEVLQPKVEKFREAQKIIEGLSRDKVEYEKAKKLGELEIAIDMSDVASSNLLLGGERTTMLTSYIAKAQQLQELMRAHDRKTNSDEHDHKELKEIAGDKKEQEKRDKKQYAAVFNFNQYKRSITQKDYKPGTGKLVTVSGLDEPEDGKVKYTIPGSDDGGKVDIRGVIPLASGDLLTAGGENAFSRYRKRVKELDMLAEKLGQRPDSLIGKLEELAERDSPPIVSL